MTNSSSVQVGGAGQVARSAVIVMAGFSLSIVVGIVRQQIVSSAFGTSSDYDAFVSANIIPELLFNMLSGGALAFAFIPTYAESLKAGEGEQASRLFSSVLNSVLMLAAAAAVVAALLAPSLMDIIAPGFSADERVLTVQLMRILLLTTVIFTVSSLIGGSLQAHTHFILPALAPSLYTGGMIFGALVLSPTMGVFGLAWGAVIGAALHFLIQLPGLLWYKVRWFPTISLRSPELRRVAFLMLPRILDLLMAQATLQWLNYSIASTMGEGRVSALQYGYTLMNMPWTLIGVTIGTAVFPMMSLLAADKDVGAQRRALSGALRAVLALAIPAAVGLIALGRPIIQLLFERGEFTADSTELVYYALQFFALMMISQSMLNVVVPAYAAQKDTWTPLFVSIFTTLVNVGLAFVLSRPIDQGGLSHGGLPLARAIAIGLEVTIDLMILRVRWGGVDARRIIVDAGKAMIAALAMGAAVIGTQLVLDGGPLITLVAGGGIGVVVYFTLALLLGLQEVRTIPAALLRGLLRRQPGAAVS